ncbi:MAG: UbiA family prenyltransferase [Lewinellaceae bacterium]|nr:UbiA family prenyltransferase [Lewinellaceae bacterium]
MNSPEILSMFSGRFWAAYWIHMRPYLLFVSGIAGLTGMAASGAMDFRSAWTFVLFLPFFTGYGLGQALTDCFQVDTDRLSAPYRPLSKGIVSPRQIGLVSISGMALMAIILIVANRWNILFSTLTMAGLATYSYFKKRWHAGPFYNAWIVVLLPVMGYLAVSGASPGRLLTAPFPALLVLTFFSYSNFVLMGYLKDISADKQTGYRTFPVVFGWDATVWVGDLFGLLALLAGGYLCARQPVAQVFWAGGVLLAIAGQWRAHTQPEKSEANSGFPIAATVRSFILWHLAAILVWYPGLWWGGILYYLLFEWVLYRRPERTQI